MFYERKSNLESHGHGKGTIQRRQGCGFDGAHDVDGAKEKEREGERAASERKREKVGRLAKERVRRQCGDSDASSDGDDNGEGMAATSVKFRDGLEREYVGFEFVEREITQRGIDDVCVFVKYNGQWDGTLRYVGDEMKGILVPETATYVGLIELVRSAIGIRSPAKTIVMRYGVEPGMPLVRIQCNADVKFYIQLKKKDVHVLSKFSITIDVLDESAAEARPPEVGESNHIDVQRSREGGQSDEAMQHVDDNNLIIFPPPFHIPSPTISLDLHTESGIEKLHQVLNNDLCTAHGDCNAGDSVSGSVVVADYTPVTMRKNCIFENKKLLQYHLHHDAMSKHYQFKVKRSNSTLLHVICIDNEGCPWQLRATRMRGSELFVVKRYDDVHTCSIEIVQVLPAWAEMVKRKNHAFDIHIEIDSGNYLQYFYMCLAASKNGWPYCRPVIVVDGSALKAKFGGMLLATCGHNANGYIFSLAFGIVPSESNESWKWFFEKLRDSIGMRESLAIVVDRHKGIEYASSQPRVSGCGIRYMHLTLGCKLEDQADPTSGREHTSTDGVHPIGSAEGWDVPEEVRSQIVNLPSTKLGPGRPRVRRILSQGEEHEPIRCGRCNGYGHNRQTCTNSVPLRLDQYESSHIQSLESPIRHNERARFIYVPAFGRDNFPLVLYSVAGYHSQNVLAACLFDMKFTYMLAGYEGSCHDARMLEEAIAFHGFPKPPPGKFYLADSGYANKDCFLSPYRRETYHSPEY
ncbi:hypothetical protein TIFTF001_027275 [Ficus carica]|uniref:Transposase n=1 Tax=Ficus carica TaxID=3494 RepID=A0AA88DMT3_FICCA|nr:hypothetical protein TIFTF001_027275 [Ficus carica]